MADYAHKAATTGSIYLETVAEYDLYCHYVAGLVGEGLSRLFAASGKEEAFLAQQLELSNSMGLLLQKTNIIRDFREDCDERRYFWPQEIWGKVEYGFKEIKEMCSTDQNTVTRATWVQSGMILNALGHATDALDYLRLLKNQSIFNFCAIPAAMAIATLELCFMNKEMFQRNIKIRKAEAAAVRLELLSVLTGKLISFFTAYHAVEKPERGWPHFPGICKADPCKGRSIGPKFYSNFRGLWQGALLRGTHLKFLITFAPYQIEAWCEQNYPSFVQLSSEPGKQSIDMTDARAKVVIADQTLDEELRKRKIIQKKNGSDNTKELTGNGVNDSKNDRDVSLGWMTLYAAGAFSLILVICTGLVWALVRYTEKS